MRQRTWRLNVEALGDIEEMNMACGIRFQILRRALLTSPLLIASTWLCVLLLGLATPAQGYIDVPVGTPIFTQVGLADCVLVGRITALSEKTVEPPGSRLLVFRIAQVDVRAGLQGVKTGASVRLGFVAREKEGQAEWRKYKTEPVVGQEALFLAVKHPTEDFHVVLFGGSVTTGDAEYAKKLAQAKRCCRLLSDPDAGLKSADAGDRLLTACLLIDTYVAGPRRTISKTEAIPLAADRSKQLLLALTDADWAKPEGDSSATPQYAVGVLTSCREISLLPTSFPKGELADPKVQEAARAWLRGNAETYRIHRGVPQRAENK